MSNSIEVVCPCKVNLTLGITGKRDDGYHLMEMVMQTISLHDKLFIELNDTGDITVGCDDPNVPIGSSNIAHRCASRFLSAIDSNSGVNIYIQKKIPSPAGLGGGSADGAGVLVGLNHLLKAGLTTEQLCEIGQSIGADIPFCIVGGTALVEGIGEIITPLRPIGNCYIVVAKPDVGVPTAGCFARYDQRHLDQIKSSNGAVSAISMGRIEMLRGELFNVLEDCVQVAEIDEIKRIIHSFDVVDTTMSGSGSAVCAIFIDQGEADCCSKALNAAGYFSTVAKPIAHGPKIL